MLDAFFSSLVLIFLSEMGDKTQLLALFLAARFCQKYAIVLGIFVATVANHVVSAWFGVWLSQLIENGILTWITGIAFIVVGLWLLIPDKDDEKQQTLRYGAFLTTVILFFLAEIGDKTQIATVILAVNYNSVLMVVLGSTIGLLLANAPVIWLGEKLIHKIPIKVVHIAACVLFCVTGIWILLKAMMA
ncbi:MAG: TMEM165/GDT1 family protein [Neisseriaceae bacterium]|nr:TMEM165/GDT1 family protein [Neisseriaceae bacterium]